METRIWGNRDPVTKATSILLQQSQAPYIGPLVHFSSTISISLPAGILNFPGRLEYKLVPNRLAFGLMKAFGHGMLIIVLEQRLHAFGAEILLPPGCMTMQSASLAGSG